jgi:hypothetical protein
MKDMVRIELHGTGVRDPVLEQKVGSDLFRKTGKYTYLEQVIDRQNDWYHKLVVDPETGAPLRRCDEPLSKHRGFGSAKRAAEGDDPANTAAPDTTAFSGSL